MMSLLSIMDVCFTGGANQKWTYTAAGRLQSLQSTSPPMCLTAAPPPSPLQCTNIWGRPLHDSSWAFAVVNNGPGDVNVTCDAACFASTNSTVLASASRVAIRDLWAHEVVAELHPPLSYTATVAGQGGSVIYRAFPCAS